MSILTSAAPEVDRDRYGRPLITPRVGGKPIAYSRCTSYIDVLDDKFNLQQWMQRMVALGLATRPDLLLSVSAHAEDKKALNRICTDAREAAAASAAATTGTALHALTELIDRGQTLPVLPPNAKASLDAYAEATKGLKATYIERFCVLDALQVGGTPDRIVKVGKTSHIADIKTGSIEWGALKIAMQLAIYARSSLYDISTGERTPHGADLERGIIIHLPAVTDPAEARCDLHWIDLKAGWQAVLVARQVRDQRKLKFSGLTEPFVSIPLPADIKAPVDLTADIDGCTDADAIRALWAARADEWTETHTEHAKARIEHLTGR